MDTDIKHITELTREDLQEIAAATTPVPGFCIRIEKSQGQLKISVDENALRLAINGFIRNGGGVASSADVQNISFNPPS